MNIRYKYSIIVPVYNDDIDDFNILINSIRNNNRRDIEIIIVDDSEEEFRDKIKKAIPSKDSFKIIYNNYRKGLSFSCNQGVEVSKGEYIIFLNCDNYINNNYFEQIDALVNKGFDFIATKNRVININDKFGLYVNKVHSLQNKTGKDKVKFNRKKNVSYTEGCVVKRQLIIDSLGFLDWKGNNLKAGEDLIFADNLRPLAKKATFQPSVEVLHSVPNTYKSFFYNRFIRGYGTIQIYRFYRGFSIIKICYLFFLRNTLNILKLTTFILPLIYLYKLINSDNKKIKNIYKNFIKVYYFEKVAIFYGELKSLINIIKFSNKKIERENLNNILKKQKILFVNPGSSKKFSNIKEALLYNDYSFDEIYAAPNFKNYYEREKNINYFISRFFDKFGFPFDLNNFNKKLLLKVIQSKYDIIIIGKVNFLKPGTLKKIKKYSKNSKIISWVDDNMMKMHNSSYFFLSCLKYYDLVTSVERDSIFEEKIKSKINKNTKLFLTLPSANRLIHKKNIKKPVSKKLCFVGFGDNERFKLLNEISHYHEIDIYGSGWDKFKNINNDNLMIKRITLPNDHGFIISDYFINLNIPRNSNDDWANYKLVELMASNIFAIHKYSEKLNNYFIEGESIVTFKNINDLLNKINYYMQNYDKALEIRENSYNIVKKLDLFFDKKLKNILDHIK